MLTNKDNRGFTLIELLAAVVIAAAITSLILSFLTSSLRSFKVNESALQLQNDGQTTINVLMDNIMGCEGLVEVLSVDGSIVDLDEVMDTERNIVIGSIAFAKTKESVEYIERYDYDPSNKSIKYSLTRSGQSEPELTGELASNIDTDGFILRALSDVSLGNSNSVMIELKFKYNNQTLSLINTARYRNK